MSPADQNTVIAAFTEYQASRLTGVSLRQLRYWAQDGFFKPGVACGDKDVPMSRLYSFRDLMCLKVINAIRNDCKIPLHELRAVKERLAHLGDDLWAKTILYILGRTVVFHNPETGDKEDARGQAVLQVPLRIISSDMRRAVEEMRRRDKAVMGKIDTKLGGSKNPVIAGTRIPVRTIKAFTKEGYSVEAILEQYPTLTADDVRAAIEFKSAA